MDLKQLLGEELYNQVMSKAGDHKLAIVSDGNWFPKEKFDTVNNDNKELKKQLQERDTQLEDLKKQTKGNEELQQQIKTLQEQNEATAKEYQERLDKQTFDFALEKALASAEAKNHKAVKALLDASKIKLDGENLLGLDEQLKALRESDAYLFGEDDSLGGRQPHKSKPNDPGAYKGKNPFSKEHFNLTEQARLYKEDPELYKKLKSQA